MNTQLESTITQLNHKTNPIGKWTYVDVQFPATPNTDCVIRHGLLPDSPNDVEYSIVRTTTGGTVYEPLEVVGAKASTTQYIILRSDTASWKGRLLLTVPKSPKPFNPLEIS